MSETPQNLIERLLSASEVVWRPLGEVTRYEGARKYRVEAAIDGENMVRIGVGYEGVMKEVLPEEWYLNP